MIKKILALLLLLSMCACALLACQADPASGDGDGSGDASTDPERDPKAPAVVDYQGYEYVIRGDNIDNYEIFAPTELNGQGINDVVYQRNKTVEKEYNVTIVDRGDPSTEPNDAFNFLTTQHQSGDYFADLYSYRARQMLTQYAIAGYFHNLYDIKGLDMDAEWWDQAYFDATSINKHAYTMTGWIQTNDEMHQSTFAVNHTLFQQYFVEDDLYEIITDGKWTWEAFVGYFQGFGVDTGAKGKVDMDDMIGYCYGADQAMTFASLGVKTFIMENGEPVLNVTSDKSYQVLDLLEKLITGNLDTAMWGGSIHTNYKLDNALKMQHFMGGNMLFTSYLFFDAFNFLEMEDEIYYLPYPKFDEEQVDYMNPVQCFFEPIAISANTLDTDRAARIADALGYYSGGLQDEVADVLLQERLSHEVKSREILILSLNAKIYDMEFICNQTNFGSNIIQLMEVQSVGEYSSKMASLSSAAVKANGKGTLQMFIKKYTQKM